MVRGQEDGGPVRQAALVQRREQRAYAELKDKMEKENREADEKVASIKQESRDKVSAAIMETSEEAGGGRPRRVDVENGVRGR